jgi:hypothetical protein
MNYRASSSRSGSCSKLFAENQTSLDEAERIIADQDARAVFRSAAVD